MQAQNFSNHKRIVPLFHIVLSLTILAIWVLAVINLASVIRHNRHGLQAILLLLITIALTISFAMIRRFPIIAQDRAIRAEENLRYFSLTGKLFDSRLTINQIIALRFAPDEELVALADRALNENLSNRDIKKAIQHWKADRHRA